MTTAPSRLVIAAIVSSSLAGCGLAPPQISEVWDQDFPGVEANAPLPNGKPAQKRLPKISATAQIEYEIKRKIYCELRRAILSLRDYQLESQLPKNWGAQISLSLEVDESSALNPGASLISPIHNATTNFVGEYFGTSTPLLASQTFASLSTPQSYAFGLGATLSSAATRTDKFDPYYTVKEMSKDIDRGTVCYSDWDPFRDGVGMEPAQSSLLIVSDLGLKDWLIGALYNTHAIPSDAPLNPANPAPARPAPATPASLDKERERLRKQGYHEAEVTAILAAEAAAAKQSKSQGQSGGGKINGEDDSASDAISIEIKFQIVSNGNVNPTWKLVRVSANTGSSPLFGVGRTRIHDLIITMGPNTTRTQLTHQASQIGTSVSSGNQAALAAGQ